MIEEINKDMIVVAEFQDCVGRCLQVWTTQVIHKN